MANYIITKDGELKHYGVIGMKWGQRKAKKAGTSYTYRSHGQKKWEKKLAKAKGASNKEAVAKAQTKLEFYKQRDENRQSYAQKTNTGKIVVKNLLLGPLSGSYNRLRATGMGKIPSALVASIDPYFISRMIESGAAKRDIEAKKKYGRK